MTYLGRVHNGRIVLDNPAYLPEGASVKVEVLDAAGDTQTNRNGGNLNAMLLRHAGKGRDLPPDLAADHDHYAHGKPKP